jgi:hypothetical protein
MCGPKYCSMKISQEIREMAAADGAPAEEVATAVGASLPVIQSGS